MTTNEELLPCPFCGGSAVLRRMVEDYPADADHPAGEFDAWFHVHCDICGIDMGYEDRSEAIAAWNRREAATRLRAGSGVRGYDAYEAMHNAAIKAYEASTPSDYRYSAVALRKAVDAALALAPQQVDEVMVERAALAIELMLYPNSRDESGECKEMAAAALTAALTPRATNETEVG